MDDYFSMTTKGITNPTMVSMVNVANSVVLLHCCNFVIQIIVGDIDKRRYIQTWTCPQGVLRLLF